MDDSAIICNEVINADSKQSLTDDDETSTIPTNFNEKKATCKTQNFYILLAFLLAFLFYLVKDIDIKNLTYYFFNDIINIEHFDQNNIKLDEKPYENIFIYCIGYVTIKKYVKIYSVNPLYFIFKTSMDTFEEIKYLTLLPINESKEKIKNV